MNDGLVIQTPGQIQISTFTPHGLTLRLPATACAVGQFLRIHLFPWKKLARSTPLSTNEAMKTWDILAKVIHIEAAHTLERTVILEVENLYMKRWKTFRAIFRLVQARVNRIVKTIQG